MTDKTWRTISVGTAPSCQHYGTEEAYNKAVKALEKSQKVKLSKAELSYGRGRTKRPEPLKIPDEVIDEAWKIYQSMRDAGSPFDSITRRLADHFQTSNNMGRKMITQARAKYITKGEKK